MPLPTRFVPAVAAAVLLAACDPSAPAPSSLAGQPAAAPGPAATAAAPATGAPASAERARREPRAAACGAVQRVPVQGGQHLIGDQPPPVPYSSTPPTSGWHSSGAVPIGVRPPGDPLSEPEQVSVLEAGGVVVSYRDLPRREYRALRRLVAERFPGRVALTRYDALPAGEVALTAWGLLQRCDGLDFAAVRAFAEEHANDAHSHD